MVPERERDTRRVIVEMAEVLRGGILWSCGWLQNTKIKEHLPLKPLPLYGERCPISVCLSLNILPLPLHLGWLQHLLWYGGGRSLRKAIHPPPFPPTSCVLFSTNQVCVSCFSVDMLNWQSLLAGHIDPSLMPAILVIHTSLILWFEIEWFQTNSPLR